MLEDRIKLRCADYGFGYDFEVKGNKEHVIMQFKQHTLDEHVIKYEKEALTQFILRKYSTASLEKILI
jgi:predicted small metal-binding protein